MPERKVYHRPELAVNGAMLSLMPAIIIGSMISSEHDLNIAALVAVATSMAITMIYAEVAAPAFIRWIEDVE